MGNHHDKHDGHDHGHHPLVPISVYVKTLLALLVLTVATVAITYVDLGKFNIVGNVGLATIKASLVMAFFMGLKYDNNLNRAFILSTVPALIIFIGFTAADLWTRPKPEPVAVKAAKSSITPENLHAFVAGSAELVARGKELYGTNCAVCHGADGKGDGAGGASLKPVPRDFHAEGSSWTHGNSVKSIYYTLAVGSPGTGMASYSSLLPEDRWALVHYLRAIGPNGSTGKVDAKADALIKEEIAASGGPAKPVLPIDFAIERVAR